MKGGVENVLAYGEHSTVQFSGSSGLRRSHGKVRGARQWRASGAWEASLGHALLLSAFVAFIFMHAHFGRKGFQVSAGHGEPARMLGSDLIRFPP